MAEVWVRLPLGALSIQGVGKLGLIRMLREHEITGSNPVILTNSFRCGQTVRRRPVKSTSEGSIPSTGAWMEGQANWRWQPPRKRSSVTNALTGSTPSPSAGKTGALGRAAKVPGFQPGEAGSTPAEHSSVEKLSQLSGEPGLIAGVSFRQQCETDAVGSIAWL